MGMGTNTLVPELFPSCLFLVFADFLGSDFWLRKEKKQEKQTLPLWPWEALGGSVPPFSYDSLSLAWQKCWRGLFFYEYIKF